MGNKQQKIEQNPSTPAGSQQISLKHPKFKSAKLVTPTLETQQPYIELTKSIPNRQVYEQWKKGIGRYTVDTNQIQTILLPKLLEFEQKGLCGNSGIVKSHYVVLPFVLNEEITNRQAIRQPFLETQLWYLLYVLTYAGATAHSRGLVLGDVRPENILMSSDGQICVCCLQSFIDEQKNYQKTLSTKQKTYLSPEQVQSLIQGKSQPEHNQQQSQSFSVGLTILSAILLHSEYELYQNNKFNQQFLKHQLQLLRNNSAYNELLRNLVENMLEVNPKDRLLCQQVVKMLRPYEQFIVNLQQFDVDLSQVPENIRQRLISRSVQLSGRSGRSNQYMKVINSSDLNRNSRINYALSPRQSNVTYQEAPFPIYNGSNYPAVQVRTQLPFRTETGNNQFIPPQNYRIRQVPFTVAQSIYAQPRPNAAYLQPPQQPQFQRQASPTFAESIPIRQLPPQTNNRPERLQIPQTITQGGSYITSPDVMNYNSKIQSYIPHQYSNQSVQGREGFEQQQLQRNAQLKVSSEISASTFNPAQYQQEKRLPASSISPITSSINSTIYENQQKFNPTQFPRKKLTELGRQTTSIRPDSDKIYQTYEQAMKEIDERLQESRRQFPDDL